MRLEIRPTSDGNRYVWRVWEGGWCKHRGAAGSPEAAEALAQVGIQLAEERRRRIEDAPGFLALAGLPGRRR